MCDVCGPLFGVLCLRCVGIGCLLFDVLPLNFKDACPFICTCFCVSCVVSCMLCVVCCLMCVVCCLWLVVCWLVVCCLFCVERCPLFGACYLLTLVCCLATCYLCIVCGPLLRVCCLRCVVSDCMQFDVLLLSYRRVYSWIYR